MYNKYFSCICLLLLMYFSFVSDVFLTYFSVISWGDVSQGEHSERRMAGNQLLLRSAPLVLTTPSIQCTVHCALCTVHWGTVHCALCSAAQCSWKDKGILPLSLQPHPCNAVHCSAVHITTLTSPCIKWALYTHIHHMGTNGVLFHTQYILYRVSIVRTMLTYIRTHVHMVTNGVHCRTQYSPYAAFYLIVSSVNSSESRCFPKLITGHRKKIYLALKNENAWTSLHSKTDCMGSSVQTEMAPWRMFFYCWK